MASEREEVADAGSHGSSKQMPNRMLGPVSNPPAALPSHVAMFFHATKQDGTALEHRLQTRLAGHADFHSCPAWGVSLEQGM